MDYGFMSPLTVECYGDDAKNTISLLKSGGFEVYVRNWDDGYELASDGSDGIFFVSAADRDAAEDLLREHGLERLICAVAPTDIPKSGPVADAEDAYYRKHQSLMVQCLVIVLFVVVWSILRAL